MRNISITTEHDSVDCETCGGNYWAGGKVYVDDELVISRTGYASCTGGSGYSEEDLLVLALYKLGINVYVDDEKWHICQADDLYHGEGSHD